MDFPASLTETLAIAAETWYNRICIKNLFKKRGSLLHLPLKPDLNRKTVLFALLTAVWMVVIFLFSAQNGDDSSATSGLIVGFLCRVLHLSPSPHEREILTFCVRKGAHMTEFGLLGLLWLGTLKNAFGRFARLYPAAFAAASVYAAADEVHQLFSGGRAGRLTDWLIDSAGILFFFAVFRLVSYIIMKMKESDAGQKRVIV